MPDPIIEVLSGEAILHSGLRTTVTNNYIVVRSSYGQKHTIIPVACVTQIRTVKTGHPYLLVISCGLFIVSAAAYSSKDGSGAGLPLALLGVGLLLSYFGTRHAVVAFVVGSEPTVTATGSLKEAAALVRAVLSVRTDLAQAPARPSSPLKEPAQKPHPLRSKFKVRLTLRWR